jgi:spermidine synthase
MLNSRNWFSEIDDKNASALSFKIKELLHSEQTPIQNIEIFSTECYGNLMALDGYIMLTTKDNFLYHEMISHPAIFTHPNPKRVAIIGGGDCGTLQQVLQHQKIEKVTQIEIDKRVTDLSILHFPELCTSNNDPRAELLFDDGLAWVKKAQAGSLDIIMVDSTDPIGPAEGLFNKRFYQDAIIALGDKGILVQQSESPLLHLESIIKPMQNTMLAAGFTEVKTLFFPQPCYPSGWWSCTMASKNLALDQFRKNDIINKEFTTKYYNLPIHLGSMATPEFMLNAIK